MKVFTRRTDAMRRILHLVCHGYIYHACGSVDQSKAHAFVSKLTHLYELDANSKKRNTNKSKGKSNSDLVLLKIDEYNYYWWLVSTPGTGAVFQLENLKDATNRKQRITSNDGSYELVKTPRKALKASWTWRMTSKAVEIWEDKIKKSIRSNNDESLKYIIESLRRVPGFRETRSQAFSLVNLIKEEWRRGKSEDFPFPDVFIGFLGRFKKTVSVKISKG
jgi:hypothetical protein